MIVIGRRNACESCESHAFGILYIFDSYSTLVYFMTCLSHQDGEHTAKTSRELAEKLSFLDIDVGILNGKLRRAAHVAVFAVFTILLGITLRVGGYPRWAVIGVVLWSYIDEATKPLIQGWHFSWVDVGLNLIGVVIGGMVLALINGAL